MKRKFIPVLLATVLSAGFALHSLTASATLKPGDTAPDFTTQASLGGKTYTYTLADELKKGPVVLYFYPAAFTKGCTIEAHEFADAVDEYKKYGATVIGAYDAGMPMHNSMANRVSYVIAPDGKIIYEYTSLSPDKHVENTLEAVKQWAATHKSQ